MNRDYAPSDQALLDASPSFISIGDLFKATPASEGGERFIYLEASNETRDLQNEIVLQKALSDSADYYLQFGNVDLEHYSLIGRPNPKTGFVGIPDYEDYEIGRPVDVRLEVDRTFVKARIHAGNGPTAERANRFWSSITDLNPPKRWFPSIGGAVLAKSIEIDADTGNRYPVINKVRWSNIGMSLTPVNPNLPVCSTVPFGVLAKCWGAHGIDMRKSLEAGYGTDSATLTGGSAVRMQSLDGVVMTYAEFRDALAHEIGAGAIAADDKQAMVREAGSRFGLSNDAAARYVERFLDDLKRGIKEQT
jgi:hypothetical protein